MRQSAPISVSLALLGAAGFAGCRRAQPRREAARAPVAVRVAAVRDTSAGGVRAVPGVVAAREAAEITSRSAATVKAVFVSEGMRVRKGQRLAQLDSGELAARISAAEAALSAASAEKARTDRLAATQAATPREKELADSAAASARAALAEARAGLSYVNLTAPFEGRVASVPIHAGDHVQPGEKLIALESDAGFEAQASIEGGAIADLPAGSTVAVRVDGIPDPVPAVVRTVSPAGDRETHRFLLRANLPADPRLRSGLFASVEVPDSSAPPRRIVPAAAVVERGGLTGVFVVDEGKASLRWIDVGPRRGDEVEVRAGLAPGDRVVLSPGDLADGAPVVLAPR
ncbi:MAG TPA: efflux RND transporter periplasmic adaptor subunit [Thermoanaerobaculia bacterium]|jgi:RND family efflux transporter MFP subunit|nr:efflux RND transporter periplasmic adaptor subunit [Thermoanaerobaculia bacterium]